MYEQNCEITYNKNNWIYQQEPTSFWLSELCSFVSFLANQVSFSDKLPITAVQSPKPIIDYLKKNSQWLEMWYINNKSQMISPEIKTTNQRSTDI